MYDYGARNYDPALGRWMNMDALSEIYVGISPYSYTLNNPVLFIDPDGNYVDDSYIYEKNKKGEYKNPTLVKAYEAFAKSKTGSAFLANFARKGQMIAGEKYKGESGKYDKKNIDLNFGLKTTARAEADTGVKVEGSHLQLTIGVSVGSEKVASDLSGFIDDIAHEAFGHVESTADDFLDDKKLNFSNIDKDLVKFVDNLIKQNPKYKRSQSNTLQHYQEERSKIFNNKTFPILKEYYRNANIKISDTEIKAKINDYER